MPSIVSNKAACNRPLSHMSAALVLRISQSLPLQSILYLIMVPKVPHITNKAFLAPSSSLVYQEPSKNIVWEFRGMSFTIANIAPCSQVHLHLYIPILVNMPVRYYQIKWSWLTAKIQPQKVRVKIEECKRFEPTVQPPSQMSWCTKLLPNWAGI